MATEKNITMKQFNGTDYDTLYPKTKVEQVEGAYSQQQILSDATKGLYGLGADAVPDNVFAKIGTFMANLSDAARIESGSYSGTGSSERKTIAFSKKPKLFFISNTKQTSNSSSISIPLFFIALSDAKIGMALSFENPVTVKAIRISWEGSSVTINIEDNVYGNYNVSGETYSYVGIR